MSSERDFDIVPKTNYAESHTLHSEAMSALEDLNSRTVIESSRTISLGSKIGPSDPDSEISITVMLKSRASEAELDATLHQIIEHQRPALSEAEFNTAFGANPSALANMIKFASDSGLQIPEIEPGAGRVVLKGSVKQFNQAFVVQLETFQTPAGIVREYPGAISLPKNLASDIEGVFGLDTREQLSPQYRVLSASSPVALDTHAYMPDKVADAYKFPKESMGEGQSVAILQFNGGLDMAGALLISPVMLVQLQVT